MKTTLTTLAIAAAIYLAIGGLVAFCFKDGAEHGWFWMMTRWPYFLVCAGERVAAFPLAGQTMVTAITMGSSSAVEQRAVNAPVAGSIPASSAKSKRLRILTNRNYADGFEAIEWDEPHRQFFWYAEERAVVACFPCDREFAEEKFIECGRVLDVTKLPNWPVAAKPIWRRSWEWLMEQVGWLTLGWRFTAAYRS